MAIITLNHGYQTEVDDEDLAAMSEFGWRIQIQKYKGKPYKFYVYASGNPTIYLHRELMGNPEGMDVDHKDGNGLNNRRSNLRIATRAQNLWNQKGRSKSGFKGVGKDANGRWLASANHLGKVHSFGSYCTAEDAARAYDKHIVALRGEFAVLNFPNDSRPVTTYGQSLIKRRRRLADRVLAGIPIRNVAEEFGVTIMTVHNICLRLGLRSNRLKLPAYLPAEPILASA